MIRNGVELGSVCSASPHGLASSCNEVSVLMPRSHTVGNLCHDSVDTALQATAWRCSVPPRLVTWALKCRGLRDVFTSIVPTESIMSSGDIKPRVM